MNNSSLWYVISFYLQESHALIVHLAGRKSLGAVPVVALEVHLCARVC